MGSSMASYSHITRRGQIPAATSQEASPGRWLKHDARMGPIAIFLSLAFMVAATFAAIDIGADVAQWWRGR